MVKVFGVSGRVRKSRTRSGWWWVLDKVRVRNGKLAFVVQTLQGHLLSLQVRRSLITISFEARDLLLARLQLSLQLLVCLLGLLELVLGFLPRQQPGLAQVPVGWTAVDEGLCRPHRRMWGQALGAACCPVSPRAA